MKIKKAILKTENMFDAEDSTDRDYPLWKSISYFMDGEIAYVIERSMNDGKYVFLGLKDKNKNKKLHYLIEQDSMTGVFIDDKEGFEKAWNSGEYEMDGSLYLNPENIELLEDEDQSNDYQNAQKWLEGYDWDNDPAADDNLATICEALQEMQKYKALEDKGLLLKPKCKPGDIVWEANPERNIVSEYEVTSIRYGINRTFHYIWTLRRGIYGVLDGFWDKDIGKTVFFSKKAAEALKEMEIKKS